MKNLYFVLVLLSFWSCNTLNHESVLYPNSMNLADNSPLVNDLGKTILERFDPPLGYNRVNLSSDTFGEYLRTLGLKPDGALVQMYNGNVKPNKGVYVSVVDLPITRRDLQTSTDSVIRLISEYLYQQKQFEKIAFHSDGTKWSYTAFSNGDVSRNSFNRFMDFIMEKVSTPSFCSDLTPINLKDIKVGDIFVQNTQPNGHAVIVVDLVENNRGEKLFLLAQGFHPAQEIQILANPNRDDLSPWYQLKEGELLTPEWRFMTTDLMRFKFLHE